MLAPSSQQLRDSQGKILPAASPNAGRASRQNIEDRCSGAKMARITWVKNGTPKTTVRWGKSPANMGGSHADIWSIFMAFLQHQKMGPIFFGQMFCSSAGVGPPKPSGNGRCFTYAVDTRLQSLRVKRCFKQRFVGTARVSESRKRGRILARWF